jgi:hypothetical protein
MIIRGTARWSAAAAASTSDSTRCSCSWAAGATARLLSTSLDGCGRCFLASASCTTRAESIRLMDLPALDDNAMVVILEHLPLRQLPDVLCTCQAWRRSLEARDSVWLSVLEALEARWMGVALPTRSARAPPPPRQSKRMRQSGKQRLAGAVRARTMRSIELSTIITYLLRRDELTVPRLRKEIRTRAPVCIGVRDFSGFSPLHLIYAFAPSRWLGLAQELLRNHGADPSTADLDGMTPLMVACANGATKGVKLLLEHGAAATLHWEGAHPEGFKRTPQSGMSAEEWAAHPMSARYPGKHTALRWAQLYRHKHCERLVRDAQTALQQTVLQQQTAADSVTAGAGAGAGAAAAAAAL